MRLPVTLAVCLLVSIEGRAFGQALDTSAKAAAPAAAAATATPDGQIEASPLSTGLTFTASAMATSAYVWRGFVLDPSAAVQPSVGVAFGPLTVTSWMNVAGISSSAATMNEHDLTVDYSQEAGPVTVSIGWINYAFVQQSTDRYSNEFYAAVSAGGYFSPKLQVFRDIQQGDGTYTSMSISHEYAVGSRGVTATPTVSLGYNHHQWTDTVGFSDLNLGVSLSLPTPVRNLTIDPFINYSHGLEASVFPKKLYGGLSVALR